MSDSSSSNNNNQETQSVEFIDKIGDHPTNSFTSPEVLNKNNYSEDNDLHHTIEDFSQSNNLDSRNESEKKVEIQSLQQDSSSEPHQIFREQSDDSQIQGENIQDGDVKSNEQQDEEEGDDRLKDENREENKENQIENEDDDQELSLVPQQDEKNNQQKIQSGEEQINQDIHDQEKNHEQQEEQKFNVADQENEDQIGEEQTNQETVDQEFDQEQQGEQQLNITDQESEDQKGEEQINVQEFNQEQQEEQKLIATDSNNQNEDEEQMQENQGLLKQHEQSEEEVETELNQETYVDNEKVELLKNSVDESERQDIQQNENQIEHLEQQQSLLADQNDNQNEGQQEGLQEQELQQDNQQQQKQQDELKQQEKQGNNLQEVEVDQKLNEAQQQSLPINHDNQPQQGQQQEIKYKPEIEQYPESGDSYSAQRQYEYMLEMQKRQSEFQRQMEELNQKYKINFRKIVDVKQESLEGNYMTGLLAIKMKYKFIDSKDQHGMTMLHNSVLGNEKELVLFLLNNGADVNSQDACNRTALMMAAHGGASQKPENNPNNIKKGFDEDSEEVRRILKLHSFNKIFKILIDRGACFATKDAFQFSALLYSVQNQNLLILFYLIYLGANLRDADMNGSSVVHWNAYKGNKFLMEVFHALNLDLFTADNQGFTPLNRSIMGISYDTIDYLARLVPPETLPNPDEKEDDGINYKIPSLSIRHNLKNIKTGHKLWYNRLLAWWSEKCTKSEETGIHPATFLFFIVSGILFYSAFKTIYSQRSYINGHSSNESWLHSYLFFFNITFFISTFIYMSFSIRISNTMVSYKNRNKGINILDDEAIDRANQLKLEEERNVPPYMKGIMNDKSFFERVYQRMNFKHLDRLLEDAPRYKATQNQEEELNRTTITDHGDEESRVGLNQKSSYNHLTFIHQIALLFENNYFTSLGEVDFKRLCGSCLKYQPEKTKHCQICKICIPNYQFHSVLFNMCICAENHLLYIIHLFSLWVSLFTYMMIQHIQFSPFLESWQIFKYFEVPYLMGCKVGIFHSFVYFGVLCALFYTSIYCSIEILGIFEDKTRDEILNPFDYSYNFEVIADKNRNLVKVQKVRTTGLIEYLKETLKRVYYRTFLHLKHKK